MQQSGMLDAFPPSSFTAGSFPPAVGVGSASDLRFFSAFVLPTTISFRHSKKFQATNLKAFAPDCHSLPTSILIFTLLYISSAPPW